MTKEQFWWHGGPQMTNWSESWWDRDRTVSSLNEEGPGIYFTTDRQEAEGYGPYLYYATPSGFNPLPHRKPSKAFLMNLYNSASDEHKELFLSNWGIEGNNPMEGLSHYLHQDSLLDAATTLYSDLFQYDAQEYIDAMVGMGYDGVIVQKGSPGAKIRKHMVVWNPRKLIIREFDG